MNRKLNPKQRYALIVASALSLAATQSFAGTSEYPTADKTRDEVKAELQEARASGELAAENQEGARFVHVREASEPASTLSRAEVVDEVRQIRESGQLLNSDPERSRFRPDTAPVIESTAPVIIVAPASPQPAQPAPESAPAGDASGQDEGWLVY